MPPTPTEILTTAMESAGVDRTHLAQRLGVDPQTLADWLAGREPIPAERMRQIESALGIEPSAGTEEPQGPPPLDPRIERMIQLAKGFDAASTGAPRDASTEEDRAPEPAHTERQALGEVIQRAILDARRTKGLTQAEIAAKIGVSPPQLTHWVRGYREIPDRHLLALARVLGLDFRQEFVRYFDERARGTSPEDRELARLIAELNEEAKAPLVRLLKRLQQK